jgi:hypothetical protein
MPESGCTSGHDCGFWLSSDALLKARAESADAKITSQSVTLASAGALERRIHACLERQIRTQAASNKPTTQPLRRSPDGPESAQGILLMAGLAASRYGARKISPSFCPPFVNCLQVKVQASSLLSSYTNTLRFPVSVVNVMRSLFSRLFFFSRQRPSPRTFARDLNSLAKMASSSTSALLYAATVSVSSDVSSSPADVKDKKHHLKNGKGFTNPWESWKTMSGPAIGMAMARYANHQPRARRGIAVAKR